MTNQRMNSAQIIKDISVLYELSLSVGQSLDLRENCAAFIKSLLNRKNLAYGEVWIRDDYLIERSQTNGATLVYATPEFWKAETHLAANHPLFGLLKEKAIISIADTDALFDKLISEKGVQKGVFAIFALDEIGFLKLYSLTTPFNIYELNQLRNVMAKFSVSVKGCLAHQRAMREIAHRKQAEAALQKAHDELEERVKERTAELQRSNSLLLKEISERKEAQSQLQSSLEEKDVLLKEIHHRVKNNLQVISSLLYLQSEEIKDQATLDMFKESQNRVKSMALIHEELYQSNDLAHIDFSEYIARLTNHLLRSYGARHIQLHQTIEPLFLTLDRAISCGLIINELLTNAMKYAFPAQSYVDQLATIWIEMFQCDKKHLLLSVRDNGIGMPQDFNIERGRVDSLGLTLVMTLTKQLKGTIEVKSEGGTTFWIKFPLLNHLASKG